MASRILELIQQSRNEETAGNIAEAIQIAILALEIAQENEDAEGVCSASSQIANIHMQLGHYSEAEEYAAKSLEIKISTVCRAQALRVLGICASYKNQLDQAESLLHQAIDISRQLGDDEGRAMGLHSLAAVVYSLRGQFELALAASAESFKINKRIKKPDWGNPMIRAEISRMIGDRQQSRLALDDLFQVSEPDSVQRGVYYCYQARLALDEDDLDGAETWLKKSRSVAETVGNPILDVWLRVEYSRWCRLAGNLPSAQSWSEDAVLHADRTGFGYMTVLAKVEQAQAKWDGGNPDRAHAMLEEILPLALDCDLRYEIARIKFFLAALAQQQETDNAIEQWVDAVDHIIKGGWTFLLERERSLAFPLVSTHLNNPNPEAQEVARMLMDPFKRVSPLPLHIYGLGRFQVQQGRRSIPDRHWQKRKAGELFRFLLLQPGYTVHRDAVIEALWPDQNPKSGQAVFHQATSAIRRILEPDLPSKFPSRYLTVEDEQVTLNLPSGSTIDFEKFEHESRRILKDQDFEALENAIRLYSDDLFPGDRFADWAVVQRERLEQIYLRLLATLAGYSLNTGLIHPCLELTHQILVRDEWNEDAVLLAMKAKLALNDRPGALILYTRLEETLRKNLNLSPRSDLQELANTLRTA